MGMFDNIICQYPLPLEGANDLDYQTKDTPSQLMDLYEIREDGSLWFQAHDIEDQSEQAKWVAENPDKEIPEELQGLAGLFGCMMRINNRWEFLYDFSGEIRFYSFWDNERGFGWVEWSGYFEAGKLVSLDLLRNDR
jgi:hypothetical protein